MGGAGGEGGRKHCFSCQGRRREAGASAVGGEGGVGGARKTLLFMAGVSGGGREGSAAGVGHGLEPVKAGAVGAVRAVWRGCCWRGGGKCER